MSNGYQVRTIEGIQTLLFLALNVLGGGDSALCPDPTCANQLIQAQIKQKSEWPKHGRGRHMQPRKSGMSVAVYWAEVIARDYWPS